MTFDYEALLSFAELKIEEQDDRPGKHRHPFRNRFEHTKRVMKWAERLQSVEGGNYEVIMIASILHDIGWDHYRNHAEVSRDIALEYLKGNDFDDSLMEKVLEAVENHNNRMEDTHLNIESYIVMDADLLDEVGAMSILWDSMAEGKLEEATYESAYYRIRKFTEKLIEDQALLKTKTGRTLYDEKLRFIEQYLETLKFELNLS